MSDLTRCVPTLETMGDVQAEVADVFEYHPWTPEQVQAGLGVRKMLEQAYLAVLVNVPPCPDRTVALRKIREARMDANSAITHGGKY